MANSLEDFILLANNLKGDGLVSLINQLLEAPGVYSFREFLELPCVKQLSAGHNREYSKLLDIFAYGTYHDYKVRKDTLPALSSAQENKLRHLTIASLAANTKCIPYGVLQKALDLSSVRQLEEMVIEAVYSGVIRGKLDQYKQQLLVETKITRDVRSESLGNLVQTLTQWSVCCESLSSAVEVQMYKVKQKQAFYHTVQQQVHFEVVKICNRVFAASAASAAAAAAASASTSLSAYLHV